MEKIFLDKNDGLAEAVEKMGESGDTEVTLVIPRNAKIRGSLANFNILKREAANLKKGIVIESVDDEVLALAEAARIPSLHPLFSGGKSKSFSDIKNEDEASEEKPKAGKKASGKKTKKVTIRVPVPSEPEEDGSEEGEEGEQEESVEEEEVPVIEEMEEEVVVHTHSHAPALSQSYVMPEEEAAPRSRKWIWALGILILILAGGAFAANTIFARATIAIDLKTAPWQFGDTITASKTATQADADRRVIPAEVFSDDRNVTQLFPASSHAQVSQKATGRITIYNAYNSSPQTLVATTRFVTGDGKIFRLDTQVTVPGATVKDGQIVPSSIDATVTADKAGPDYNVPTVAKLTIPGFQGSPRYTGFYGSLPDGTKDGFVGERAVPTDDDITAAKAKTTDVLKTSLQGNLLNKRPKDFKVLDGTTQVSIVKLVVNKNTDEKGNFTVFGEATLQAIGFRESDVQAMLLAAADKDVPGTDFHTLQIDYKDPQVSADKSTLTMTVDATGSLASSFSADDFRNKVAGATVDTARTEIMQIPGLADGKISVWPLWLRSLPSNVNRITLDLNYL